MLAGRSRPSAGRNTDLGDRTVTRERGVGGRVVCRQRPRDYAGRCATIFIWLRRSVS